MTRGGKSVTIVFACLLWSILVAPAIFGQDEDRPPPAATPEKAAERPPVEPKAEKAEVENGDCAMGGRHAGEGFNPRKCPFGSEKGFCNSAHRPLTHDLRVKNQLQTFYENPCHQKGCAEGRRIFAT